MNKKMNKKKENRMAVRQAAAKAVLRDEQNRRIQFAATNPEGEVHSVWREPSSTPLPPFCSVWRWCPP